MTIDWLYKKKITVIFSNPCVYSSMQLCLLSILRCTSIHANKQWSLCEIQGDNNSIILLTSLNLSGILRHIFLTDNNMRFALHLKIQIFY